MPMTPDAKTALSNTVRALREQLLRDLDAATEGAYRLSLKAADAQLSEANTAKRKRLEDWLAEQVRTVPEMEQTNADQRFLQDLEKLAAATLLNRIVFLRLLEANDLRPTQVVTGGWESPGYREFREFAVEIVQSDDTEGYAPLLQLMFDDLAIDLPGLFGEVGLTDLIPVPASTLRVIVEALDKPELESCWTDDMTLGWVYQYWNDPEREAIDAKLDDRGKLESHEIASKTQMFTERYMVDWLLQNSLGPIWLAICKKNGWQSDAEKDGTLAVLEARRSDWRKKRESGAVQLTELMPLTTPAEQRWAYYVPQALPEDAVDHANNSIRDVKILDPAVGSGHFLVMAFDLLIALYQEEARHRDEAQESQWSIKSIVERILEHNLNGIDLDPRAVQIAAAALWIKAQQTCKESQPKYLNLVASDLKLSNLSANDLARRELREEVERETGIPKELVDEMLDALAGADHLGSLLQINTTLDSIIEQMAGGLVPEGPTQIDLVGNLPGEQRRLTMSADAAKGTVLARIEAFVAKHGSGEDLGLRLHGEQLATGVRFIRMLTEGSYDLVVANPPYQGTSKMRDAKYIEKHYKLGKADLYAAFLLRGLQLVRKGGVSAMLTMRNWMFIKQFEGLRTYLLTRFNLKNIGDLSWGSFEVMRDNPVSMSIFRNEKPTSSCTALSPTDPQQRTRTKDELKRKRAGLLCHVGRYDFVPEALKVVPQWPLVYWWDGNLLNEYTKSPLVGEVAPARFGVNTGNNPRFVRRAWEISNPLMLEHHSVFNKQDVFIASWVPYIKGDNKGGGRKWCQSFKDVINWKYLALSLKVSVDHRYGNIAWKIPNEKLYFRSGVAFAKIGAVFSGRMHRFRSVIDSAGSSVFAKDQVSIVCLFNSQSARFVLESLNPTVNFQVGDVNRLPMKEINGHETVGKVIVNSFNVHESTSEPSMEFKSPGSSPWRNAQDWAQKAVDRSEGQPMPEYVEFLDPEPPTDHVSYALGVALGRFGANAEGILDPEKNDLSQTLSDGICYLDGSLADNTDTDSLGHPAASLLNETWHQLGNSIEKNADLRTWLRTKFFPDIHKGMYENRPIYFPLSSEKKTFVAFVSIHRWNKNTLRSLLAEHLLPTQTRLEGEIADLRIARQSDDRQTVRDTENRYDKVDQWRQELTAFIECIEQCAEKGPPPPDEETPEIEINARYDPVLDDGVMINSAALWPLLEPQWKDPKKWWKQLALADPRGNKDYDWSHLAARYYPTRVDKKCQKDPSLAVAHGCFWKYHAANAYKWELRLQYEIGPDFTLDESGSDDYRRDFEINYADEAEQLVDAEQKRRERERKKTTASSADAESTNDINTGHRKKTIDA